MYDFGLGADAERRAPESGTAGRVELGCAEAAQTVGELAVDARCDPGKWKKLAEMCVAG